MLAMEETRKILSSYRETFYKNQSFFFRPVPEDIHERHVSVNMFFKPGNTVQLTQSR